MPGHGDRAHRLPARRIEGDQVVSGRKPDVLTVIRDAMHLVDTRKGSILTDDFGGRSFHASILDREGRESGSHNPGLWSWVPGSRPRFARIRPGAATSKPLNESLSRSAT